MFNLTEKERQRLREIIERYKKTTPALVARRSNEPDAGKVHASLYTNDNDVQLVNQAELTIIDRAGGAMLAVIWDSYNLTEGGEINDAEFIARAYEDVPFMAALIASLTGEEFEL